MASRETTVFGTINQTIARNYINAVNDKMDKILSIQKMKSIFSKCH